MISISSQDPPQLTICSFRWVKFATTSCHLFNSMRACCTTCIAVCGGNTLYYTDCSRNITCHRLTIFDILCILQKRKFIFMLFCWYIISHTMRHLCTISYRISHFLPPNVFFFFSLTLILVNSLLLH